MCLDLMLDKFVKLSRVSYIFRFNLFIFITNYIFSSSFCRPPFIITISLSRMRLSLLYNLLAEYELSYCVRCNGSMSALLL